MQEDLISILRERNKDIFIWDDFNNALVGYASIMRGGKMVDVALYDKERSIDIIISQSESLGTEDPTSDAYSDALEYVEYNLEGSYIGPGTPILLDRHQSKLDV